MADNIYVDNAVPFGSKAITIGGVVYECENISVKRPTKKIEREDHIGQPNGFVLVPGFVQGTMTVQLATADTGRISVGDRFDEDFGRGVEHWVMGETDDAFPQKEYWKQNVTFHLSPNPPAA